MKKILFSLLIALSCVTAFSQSTYNNTYTKKQSEDIFATKAALSNTVAGAEGIRSIGALGNYTLEKFIEDTAVRGVSRDLPSFVFQKAPISNLIVTWLSGDVYDPIHEYYHISSGTKTLTDNAVNYAYWNISDPTGVKWTTGFRPNAESNIYLGTFSASFGMILDAQISSAGGDFPVQQSTALAAIMPSLIVNGLNAYAGSTNLDDIRIESGTEMQNGSVQIDHPAFSMSITNVVIMYGHTNSVWAGLQTNKFPLSWDNGTNIVPVESGKWYRGTFYAPNGSQHINWVLPHQEYTNEIDAIAGNDPDAPPGFDPYVPLVTAYVFSGDDTSLSLDSKYWIDRRFKINRGSGSSGGGGTAVTPSLAQVLLVGAGTGGILPTGMGNPVTDDQAASKGYVDSTRNKASTGTAYVDSKTGDDITGRIQAASLPFKTIQKAIDACAVVATDTNRFLISMSIGTYVENVTMSNFVSIRGQDVESTIIEGQLTYPPAYTDVTGAEIAILTIRMTNAPAFILNAGADDAYVGIRSGAIYSSYTEDKNPKAVNQISRGNLKMYATTWLQLDVEDVLAQRPATIYYLTTDSGNSGTYHVNSFSSSHIMNILDTNDTVSIAFCNATTKSFFASKSDATQMRLADSDTHGNRITAVVNKNAAKARSFVESSIVDVELADINNCDVVAVSSTGSTAGAVSHFNNSRIIVPNIINGNLFYGSSSTTSDVVEVINSQIGSLTASYPKRYTESGALGQIAYVIQHASGDQLFGGGIDMQAGVPSIMPETGHVKLYTYPYAGLENPNFIDSTGLKARLARDHFFNGYNADATAMPVGTAVYVASGISPTATPVVKKCIASDPTTMPCAGIVVAVSGIGTGLVGRVMRGGRTESYFNTSFAASGDKLYVSETVLGGLTNVAPTGTNISQQVGWCHVSSTNGYMNVYLWTPDTLGNLTPNKYVTYTNSVFSASVFKLTNGGTAKFSIEDIPAGTTNTYILPSVGGQLATYTDIQVVPVSVYIGEVGGIIKGRAVYQSGVFEGKPVVKYADRSDPSSLPIVGVSMASGDSGEIIEVANFGPLNNIDTSLFTTNDLIYLGNNGALAKESSISTDAIILLGTCMSSNAVTGSILVNIRSYFMDGPFNGSMRYTVKNSSSVSNATANFFAINEANEAMRMGIRSTNHFQGAGSYLVSGANGNLMFGNLKKRGYVWNIDMTDSGNIYNHNSWPMMSLVPQANSNAFLGLGTTNPLAKLHVTGSMLASNSFRLAIGVYSNNELIAYVDTTNLINIAYTNLLSIDSAITNSLTNEINVRISGDTNLQAQIVSATNVTQQVNTNLQSQIRTETNRAFVAESSLQTQINSATNSLTNEVNARIIGDTNLQAQIVSATNRTQQVNTNLQAQINSATNSLNINTTNSQTQINNETNRAFIADTNLQTQIVSITNNLAQEIANRTSGDTNLQAQIDSSTNRIRILESGTSVWYKASTDAISATSSISVIESYTQTWNTASTDSSSATNWMAGHTNAIESLISPKRFKANVGVANITYAQNLTLVPYTNIVLAASGGSIYSNGTGVCQWWPKATSGVVRISGSWQAATANNATYVISIYKKGTLLADVYEWNIILNMGNNNMGSTWTFVDTTTPTLNDYYQIYTTFSANRASVRAGTNNWWYGEVIP
jgi:hypothetical protein